MEIKDEELKTFVKEFNKKFKFVRLTKRSGEILLKAKKAKEADDFARRQDPNIRP